jgi:hypothetical protein
MKILYLSCHSILEYDELRIFDSLGADVFSHGAYHNPTEIDDKKRPILSLPFHKKLSAETQFYPKENLSDAMIAWADVIICMHVVDWFALNWERIKHKRCIMRTIGQSTKESENAIRWMRDDGLEIVRYSPREITIPGYQGADATIRFGKRASEFGPYLGTSGKIMAIGQSFKSRNDSLNYDIFEKATDSVDRVVYGPHNEDMGNLWGGCPDYDGLRDALRQHSAYFYTGTYPASYTLGFIEAAMSGQPMIALGDRLGNGPHLQEQRTYEVAELLKCYDAGVTGDSVHELRQRVSEIMTNEKLRRKYSNNIRDMALDLFDEKKIRAQWKAYLKL